MNFMISMSWRATSFILLLAFCFFFQHVSPKVVQCHYRIPRRLLRKRPHDRLDEFPFMNMTISLCVMYDVLCIVCYVFCVMFTCGVCFVCFVWCVLRFFFFSLLFLLACISFGDRRVFFSLFSFSSLFFTLYSWFGCLGWNIWGDFFFLMALGLVGVWDWNGNGNGKWHGCLDT